MTNLELLALDISRMKHCRKIMRALPSVIVEVSVEHRGDSAEETPVLVGDIAVLAQPSKIAQHAG